MMNDMPRQVDYQDMESRMQRFWESNRVFEKRRDQNRDNRLFSFLDGPITANNPMGVHHAWGRTLKDVFLRYKAMNGFSCRYQNGFDCQGLWVEVEVEKSLGYEGKRDIESHGLAGFAQACRSRVDEFAAKITEQSKRLGQWMEWDHSYFTHTDENIRGIWHFLKKCHEHGWLYRKGLPMPWCPRCGTSLSEHEMAGSYKLVTHTAVFAHLPLRATPQRRLLLWTTTPWTLAANVAAAAHPALDYVEVSSPQWGHSLVLCKQALRAVEQFNVSVKRTLKGEELIGLEYNTFFPEFAAQKDVTHRVVPWEDVSPEEGSGIVHIAPGCGLEDYELGLRHELPVPCPVDEFGVFTEGYGWLTGKEAATAAPEVIENLRQQGKLLASEEHEHSYPVCWRCKTGLLFRLVEEWFIRCGEIRPRMIDAARTVEWTPPHMGKRMEDWLDNMGDWCISRKRYWGLPLPFYPCEHCGCLTVAGSREELRKLAADRGSVDATPELHRPWIDEVRIHCPQCGTPVKRIPEVGDCWLDAGIVPFTTLGYFSDREAWDKAFPADWVCEMREQVRLWFYSMLFMGVTLAGRAPYKKVLAYERVVAEDGSMFSKTGHMIHFDEAVSRMGADPMRYLYCSQPVSSDLRFGFSLGEHVSRKLNDLWNLCVFFTTYASIDRTDLSVPVPMENLHVTDRWLLARTAQMTQDVREAYERWDTPAAARATEEFVDDVSNWYVRVNRRRFWRNEFEDDKRACYSSMLHALESLVSALAPITPHLCEEVWQRTTRVFRSRAPESVHLAPWPVPPEAWKNSDLLARTAFVRRIVNAARNLRERTGLRVRQPLKALYVVCDAARRDWLREQEAVIVTELNVKQLLLPGTDTPFEEKALRLDLKAAGPVLRGNVKRVQAALESLDNEAMASLIDAYERYDALTLPACQSPVPKGVFSVIAVPKAHIEVAREHDLAVAIDTELTHELRLEGLARDFVRHVQTLRKELALDVQDRIEVRVDAEGSLAEAISRYENYIKAETLAVRVSLGLPNSDNTRQLKLGEATATVGVTKHVAAFRARM